MASNTQWVAKSTYMPGEYAVIPDGDLRWLAWSPRLGKADAELMSSRLNERHVTQDEFLSALATLKRFTPSTTLHLVEQMGSGAPLA